MMALRGSLARFLVLCVLLALQRTYARIWTPTWPHRPASLVRCAAAAKPGARGNGPIAPSGPARFGRTRQFLVKLRNETEHLIDRVEDAIEDEVEAIGRFVKRERLALEHFEDQVEDAWRRTRVARSLCVKGVAGSALLFTGAHFSRCVVLAHTLRVTGWPILQRAFKEIGNSYKQARAAVQAEVGHLLRPVEILQAVKYEITMVQRLVKESQEAAENGDITDEEAAEVIKQAQVDVARLNKEAWVLNQAVDSVSAITAAIDFKKLKDVSRSIYTGALAVFASANSITVRNLSLAFDLGALIGTSINCIAQSLIDHYHAREIVAEVLPPETRKLLSLSIGCIGAVKGLVIVRAVVPKMSLRISSAALGAAWVSETIADVLDPHLEKMGWPVIENRLPYVPLHLGLTILGYTVQKRYAGKHFPRLIEQVLTPLTLAEAQLRKYDKVFKGK